MEAITPKPQRILPVTIMAKLLDLAILMSDQPTVIMAPPMAKANLLPTLSDRQLRNREPNSCAKKAELAKMQKKNISLIFNRACILL